MYSVSFLAQFTENTHDLHDKGEDSDYVHASSDNDLFSTAIVDRDEFYCMYEAGPVSPDSEINPEADTEAVNIDPSMEKMSTEEPNNEIYNNDTPIPRGKSFSQHFIPYKMMCVSFYLEIARENCSVV